MTPTGRSFALGGLGFACLALLAGLAFPLQALRDSCAVYGIVLVSWPLWAAAVIVSIAVAWSARDSGRIRHAALLALGLNLAAFATIWLPFPGSCS
jgi:hypothetical protein